MASQLSRRAFLHRAGLLSAGLLLVSCTAPAAPAGSAGGSNAAPSRFKVTEISAPSWWAPHEIAGAEAAFNSKFKEQTGLTVKYDFIGSDFNTKVFTNLASGDPYDVITLGADLLPIYLDRGVVLPLNDLIERDKYDLSNFVPSALEQWTYDDQLYGLTNDMGSFHCYFNKDLFKAAGLTAPASTDEWTWDQLADWAQQLTVKEGDQTTQYGFAATSIHGDWDVWPNLNGTDIFAEGLTKSQFDDPAVIEAFDFYQNLMYDKGVALKPGSIQTGANELFLAGQLAILLDGTWQVGWLRSKKDEVKFTWDVGVPPHNANVADYFIPNFTAGWVIPKNAPDVDASWEAVKFYASDTFAKEVMFVSLSGLPTTKSALEGAWYAQWPENPPEGLTRDFYAKLLDHGRTLRYLRYDLGAALQASVSKLDLVFTNEQEPAQLFPTLAGEVNQELSERPWNQ